MVPFAGGRILPTPRQHLIKPFPEAPVRYEDIDVLREALFSCALPTVDGAGHAKIGALVAAKEKPRSRRAR